MNPLMTEEKVIELIEEVGKPDNWPYNEHYFWWSYKKPLALYIRITNRGYLMIYPNDLDKLSETLFDLAMHHYISNVKRFGRTMEVRFKECRGGREPNFGARTIQKIVRIIEKACVPEDPF